MVTMVIRFQKIRAVDPPNFLTGFLRNGSFIPEHAGRRKDITCSHFFWADFDFLSG